MSLDKRKIAYTYEEAAEAVGVSVRSIRRLVANGDLCPRYPTSKPVILATELEDWAESLPSEPRSA